MFTQGFIKIAWGDASSPPPMPSAAAAEAVRKGMNKPVGQQMAQGWSNLKNEMGSLFNAGKAVAR